MLDCCLDYSPVYNYLPLTTDKKLNSLVGEYITGKEETLGSCNFEIKKILKRSFVDSNPEFNPPEMDFINFSRVDIILVSNFESIDALPYITEHSGFKGQVFATEPTKEFGRLLMEDLVENCKKYPKDVQSSMWKHPSNKKTLPECLQKWENNFLSWRSIYSKEDIYKSVQKIKSITYNEVYEIFGALRITAHPSGYSIGSCNWTIQSDFEKIAYMSSSSKFISHPQFIDEKPLCNADALLFAGMTQAHGTDVHHYMNAFIDSLKVTMDRGGNMLVPTQPCGVVLDLITRLSESSVIDNNRDFTIYFISPTAKGCLSFSQIYAEWLQAERHNFAYQPQPPFHHNELIDLGKIKVKSSVKEITIGKDGKTEDFKQPCLVFASHPSLRMGEAVHFMNMWGKNTNNAITFIDPNFSHTEALAPFHPVLARVYNLPMDKRLDAKTSTIMLDKLAPKRVFAPAHYLNAPTDKQHRTDWRINTPNAHAVHPNSVVKVNLNRSHEKVFLQPELASSLVPKMTSSGAYLSSMTAQITTMDNKHTLSVPEKSSKIVQISLNKLLCCGKIELDSLFKSLKKDNFFGQPELDRENKTIKTNLFSLKSAEDETKVTFHSQDEKTRKLITDKIFAFCKN